MTAQTGRAPTAGRGLAGVRTLDDVRLPRSARVLARFDWNTPLAGGLVADASRVEATLPTLIRLRDLEAEVTVATHLGYPGGRPDGRLKVQTLLGPLVHPVFPGVRIAENVRFFPGEEANDPAFAASLAEGHDIFLNDAFSCAHRPHASVVGLPALLPSLAGPLFVREVRALEPWLSPSSAPTGLLLGGAKLGDKFRLLSILADRTDVVTVGGLAALPFLVAVGRVEDDDRVDPRFIKAAATLLGRDGAIHLPTDVRVRAADGDVAVRTGRLRPGDRYLDVGPDTCERFAKMLSRCARILWNGPLGHYEQPPFHIGTAGLAAALDSHLGKVTVGGGDTCAALRRTGLLSRTAHASTGGGAMLSLLADGDLVGLAALRRSSHHWPK
ncbi:phosphoglycerate kinase [Spirillospora sp. NBC_00431]